MRRFLSPEFLHLFIFDGEFAGRLLDGNDAEADRVVDALCQLYLLDDVAAFAEEYWEKSAKADTIKTSSGLSKIERERDQLAAREKTLREAYAKAKARSETLTGEIRDLKGKIDARVNSVDTTRERHEAAQLALEAARGEVNSASIMLMAALRLPHALHPTLESRLVGLRDNLDRLKLPENTSAQFFEELVREDECICGRPMNEDFVREIKERAKRYLDADDAGLINALKRDIEQFTGGHTDPDEDAGHERVVRLSGDLTKAVRRENEAAQDVRVLKQQLISAGDRELADWEDTLKRNADELAKLQDVISSIEGPGDANDPPEKSMSLSLIGKRLKEANDRIAEIRGTVRLRKQTELIKSILGKAAVRARQRIKEELLAECNERLAAVLANDPLRIERIDRSIRLRTRRAPAPVRPCRSGIPS